MGVLAFLSRKMGRQQAWLRGAKHRSQLLSCKTPIEAYSELGMVLGNGGAKLVLWVITRETGREANTQLIACECKAYVPGPARGVAGKGEVFARVG